MGLTKNLEIELTDDLLNDIYKPSYSTSQFLSDNNLKTEIGKRKTYLALAIISFGIVIFAVVYYSKTSKGLNVPLMLAVALTLIAVSLLQLKGGRRRPNDLEPIVRFQESGLALNQRLIRWKDVYDWTLEPGGKGSSDAITINFYDAENAIGETRINLSTIDIDKIDFLLLMVHFKGKYGQANIS